jgi:hypothetical protein
MEHDWCSFFFAKVSEKTGTAAAFPLFLQMQVGRIGNMEVDRIGRASIQKNRIEA